MLKARAYPEHFEVLRATLGLQTSVKDLWSEYVTGMARKATCHPGIHSGLRKMREAGWTLGIVTNGAVDIQMAKLERAGIASLVDGVCISDEVGVRKPSRLPFELAAERCGTTLAQGGWMVGDNAASDIEGGRAAGLRTAWVGTGCPWPSGAPEPDLRAEDAAEAVALLLEQGNRSPSVYS